MTSVEYALMGLRDGIAMRSELRKRLPKKPTMSEPIVMYQCDGESKLYPYTFPIFYYFRPRTNGIFYSPELIAKWKIYLK